MEKQRTRKTADILLKNLVEVCLFEDYSQFFQKMLSELYRDFGDVKVQEHMLLTLDRLPFFSAEDFKEQEKTGEQIQAVYYNLWHLPECYKRVLLRGKFYGEGYDFGYGDMLVTLVCQHIKGVEKYGQTIDDCPQDAYDWNEMAREELADLLVYLEKGKKDV